MRGKKIALAGLTVGMCTVLTGCGTTLADNTSQYFSQVSTVLGYYSNSSEDDDSRLAAPEDVKLDRSGEEAWTYSFSAAEGASSYKLTLYDINNTSSGSYISETLEDNGSNTYEGSIEAQNLTYGEYRFQVTAVPGADDKEHKASKAGTYEFDISGEVGEPAYAYLWDCFSGTLQVQITNLAEFAATDEPESIEVKLTNEEDSSDVITLGLENPSLADRIYYVETSDVTPNAAYEIAVSAEWNENFVTNPGSEVILGTVTTSSKENMESEGFGYLHSNISLSFDFPAVQTGFHVKDGGQAGLWYYFYTNDSTDPAWGRSGFPAMSMTMGGEEAEAEKVVDEGWYFYAIPSETVSNGSLYSYKVEAASGRGSAFADIGFATYEYENASIPGTLEIYEDGTFTMSLDYVLFEFNTMVNAPFEFDAKQCSGIWTDNKDGTINLSYDLSSIEVID